MQRSLKIKTIKKFEDSPQNLESFAFSFPCNFARNKSA